MSPRSFERDPSLISLGRAVRAIRQEKKLTQEEVALKAQMHVTYVSQIELGRSNVTWVGLRRVSDGLGLRLSELVGRAEELEGE